MVGTLVAASVFGLTAGTVAYAAAVFAVNFALSSIVTRMFGDNPESQQDMGVRQQVPPSAVNAIPIVYGDAYMGGTFVDAVLSENQKAMYYVLAISSISPNGQFTFDQTEMYYGDRLITFDGTDLAKVISLTDEADNVDTKINGYLWIGLYTSSQTGVITSANGWYAPSVVMGATTPFTDYPIATAQQWPATNRQMNGTAFAIVTLIYSRDADTTQLQPITFKVKQALNGTGVAKPGDVWNDYITNVAYGGAVDPAFVNSASATALNTYSDELITFTDSDGNPATQPRYRINGVLDAGQSVLSNIDRIVSACDSWMTYNAALGQWSVVINKAESASYAFTDDNIIGEIRVSATDITSSINQVEARFPFKENRDQAAFVNIETPSGLLYPNEPVNKYSITYDLVNNSVQAHYLANRLLEQAREDLIVSFSTTYFGIQVDAGNIVGVTNSDYGWNNKLFRVMKVNEASLPDGSLGARLEMSEYNAQVYDDKDITEFTPVPNSNLSSSAYFSALTKPIVTSTSPDSAIPNFSVQVYIPISGRVTGVQLYYTTVATPSSSDWVLFTQANSIDGTPIAPNSNYLFENLVLPTGADSTKIYYFAYVVFNATANSKKSPISDPFSWTPNANAGPFVDISGFTSFSKSTGGSFTPAFATLTAITQNITSPTYSWVITSATPTTGSLVDITITPDSGATSIVAELTVDGDNLATPITRSVTMAIVEQGTSGNQFATAYLYQWNTVTPTNPSGSSTYTWLTGESSAYTGGGGWSVTAPANPGTPLIRLWVASKQVSAAGGTTTSTVSWASGYSISDGSQNGANGVQNATPTVYQWAATIPTISGTSTYTWASGTFTPTPSGWSTGITTAPSAGYTLWSARVQLTESATVTTTTINWTTASIVAAGYSGTNGATGAAGASARLMYARIAGNPTPVAGTVTVSGDNRPTGAQASAVWGASFNVTWYASDPDPTSNNSLYQSDGVWDGTTSTTWSAPYISALKVGTLSAITVNTGALTVQNALTMSTAGYIIGGQTAYNTGTGFFLGYSGSAYKFSIGAVKTGAASVITDTITLASHGYALYSQLVFTNIGSITNITTTKVYCVINVTTNTFQISELYAGTALNLLGSSSSVEFTTQSLYWDGSALNITGNFRGGTIAIGSGNANSYAFNVTASGAVYVDNIFGGLGRYTNDNNTGVSLQAYTSKAYEALIGTVNATNSSAFAHGVRGQNIYANTSGLVGVANGYDFYADGSGTNYGPFTGNHDILLPIDQTLTEGTLLVDVTCIAKNGWSNAIFQVAPSTQANQAGARGVFVGELRPLSSVQPPVFIDHWETVDNQTFPVMTAQYEAIKNDYWFGSMNALGEGQIQVCGENGNIAVDTLIVASSTTGVGMAQTDDIVRGFTVAKAREAITFSSPTDIQTVACIYISG